MRGSARWFMAAGGLGALICGLAIVDERVRNQLSRIVSGRAPTGELAAAGAQAQEITALVVQAVRDQSIQHAPLTIFALAALVLLLFMTRT